MANQLILHPQKFNFSDVVNQFPSGKYKKKVFFQSELRSLDNGDASFGVIAYPGWKGKGKWAIGKKIIGINIGQPEKRPFNPPLAFANNELLLEISIRKKKKKKSRKTKKTQLLKVVRKIMNDKKILDRSVFHFNAKISENPHLEYDVTLDMGDTTFTTETNPSPPAKPED